MTALLDKAVQSARSLPADMQDDIARMVLTMAGENQQIVFLTPEEEASFSTSRAQAERGEFATEAQVRAVWAKHGL